MKFDRVIQDLVAFVHDLLWWRKGKIKEPPYTRLEMGVAGALGTAHHIRKKLQPGAPDRILDSWMFLPKRVTARSRQVDVHLDCAWLGAQTTGDRIPLNKVERKQGSRRKVGDPTHEITIMRASHWVQADGKFDTEQIYSCKVDLQGDQEQPHLYVARVMRTIALRLIDVPLNEIDWAFEVNAARQQGMGSKYTPPPRSPAKKPTPVFNAPQILKEGESLRRKPNAN